MLLESVEAYLCSSTLEQGVLYNKVINTCLTKLFTELGVVRNVDALVVYENACSGILQLFSKVSNNFLLLLWI